MEIAVVTAAANTKLASEGPLDVLVLTLETFWWLWATIALLGLSRAVWRLYQWRRLARSGIAEIDAMDGRTFELFLVTLFQRLGYDAEHTGRAYGDYGADLVVTAAGKRAVVQAKRASGNVGVKAVQEAVAAKGMYGCAGALVVTNGGYTKQARNLARVNDVELWDRDALIQRLLRAERTPQDRPSNGGKADATSHCAICNIAVSEKVKAYCVAHAKRFGGRIYCFKHQRGITTPAG